MKKTGKFRKIPTRCAHNIFCLKHWYLILNSHLSETLLNCERLGRNLAESIIPAKQKKLNKNKSIGDLPVFPEIDKTTFVFPQISIQASSISFIDRFSNKKSIPNQQTGNNLTQALRCCQPTERQPGRRKTKIQMCSCMVVCHHMIRPKRASTHHAKRVCCTPTSTLNKHQYGRRHLERVTWQLPFPVDDCLCK